jgi:hypothetical protein
MGKRAKKKSAPETESYKQTLHNLQVELVKLQRHLIKNNLRILILLEGRDASGKDGVVKRINAHLSPRDTRVVALGNPSDHDRNSRYFKRYVASLPAAMEDQSNGQERAAALGRLQCHAQRNVHPDPRICDGLSFLGVQFDENRNAAGEPVISADAGHVQVRVIRTYEDVIIATAVFRMLAGTEPSQHTHFEE